MSTSRNALTPGYKLHWYIIKDILGQGGFGITYLAQDTNLNQLVAIKEFLPIEMAVRDSDASVHPVSGEQGENYYWGLERFISEARTLARFKHNNIVRVMTVFTENNTAYMIMEYEHGQALHEMLKDKGRLAEGELLEIIMPIMGGLEHVHAAGFIHRDIKPPNIFIRDDGSPVLLDFGSARQSLGEHARTLTTMVSPGYAPFEQYVSKSDKQGPWTDIYGLGATMYRAVTGKSPPNAVDRSEALLHSGKDIFVPAAEIRGADYSSVLLGAIDHALAFRADDRPRSIVAWRGEMTGAIFSGTAAAATERLPQTQGVGGAVNTAIPSVRIDVPEVPAAAPAAAEQSVRPAKPDWGTRYIRLIKRLIWATVIVTGIIVLVNLAGKRAEVSPPVTSAGSNKTDTFDTDKTAATDSGGPASGLTGQATASSAAPAGREDNAPVETSRVSRTPRSGTQSSTDLISSSDQRKLATLRERLRVNPDDKSSERQLRTMINDYNNKVRVALREGDLSKAEAYVSQLMELAPDNKRLEQALEKIREARDAQQ